MRQFLTVSIAFGVCLAIPAMAQVSSDAVKTPKQVVEEFLSMETKGGRLTPEGWEKANGFFLHPLPTTHEKRTVVISKDYSVYETSVKEDRAEVYNDFEDIGRIDSELRYKAPPSRSVKTTTTYHLVWSHRSNPSVGAAGAFEWKITDPLTTLWLNVETAMRYVAAIRDQTEDPVVRKNADETLAILKRRR